MWYEPADIEVLLVQNLLLFFVRPQLKLFVHFQQEIQQGVKICPMDEFLVGSFLFQLRVNLIHVIVRPFQEDGQTFQGLIIDKHV